MRLAVDLTAPRVGGGLTYLLQFLRGLRELPVRHEIWILVSLRHKRLIPETWLRRFRFRFIPFHTLGARVLWQQALLSVWLRVSRIDALLAPFDSAPVFSPCPVVLFVQNLNPYVGPRGSSVCSRLRERCLKVLTYWGAKKADRVVFPSEYARSVVASVLSLPEGKTRVVPLGVTPEFFEVKRASAPAEDGACSLLVVSSIRGHKDHITVLRAASELAKNGFPMRVQFAGPILDAHYHRRLVQVACRAGISDKVLFLGNVDTNTLMSLCYNAAAFVLPSHVESFGLPILEAMAARVPCVAADIPVMHELCGNGVLYYEPGNFVDLAGKVVRLLTDPQARLMLVETAVRRARQYNWTDHVARMMALLEEVAAGGKRSQSKGVPATYGG